MTLIFKKQISIFYLYAVLLIAGVFAVYSYIQAKDIPIGGASDTITVAGKIKFGTVVEIYGTNGTCDPGDAMITRDADSKLCVGD